MRNFMGSRGALTCGLLSILLTAGPFTARAVELQPDSQQMLEIVYDPAELNAEPPTELHPGAKALIELSKEMQTDEYLKRLESEVVVPVGIADDELRANALQLPPAKLDKFIDLKGRFLAKTARSLSLLQLPTKSINKTLDLMNKAFYQNAPVVADANTKAGTIQYAVALGIGLPDWLMGTFRKIPLLNDLPERAGFYLMLSTGFSISHTTVGGEAKVSIAPIFDVRRATKIFSPYIFASTGLTGTMTWENREQPIENYQRIGFMRVSALNMLSDPKHFGFAGSVALAFPPLGGAIAGFSGDIHRFRVTPSSLRDVPKNLMEKFRRLRTARACVSAYKQD